MLRANERNARAIAAPRVFRKRRDSGLRAGRGLAVGCSRRPRRPPARRAASTPCPSPSIAATSMPSARVTATARSPLASSPRPGARGEAPVDRFVTLALSRRSSRRRASSSRNRHFVIVTVGALVRAGRDLEAVHQPPRAGQAEPEAAPARLKSSRSAASTSRMPGPSSRAIDDRPYAVRLLDRREDDLALADVHHDVPRDLRDRCRDQRRIGTREAEPLGHRPSLGAGSHQILVAVDRNADLIAPSSASP